MNYDIMCYDLLYMDRGFFFILLCLTSECLRHRKLSSHHYIIIKLSLYLSLNIYIYVVPSRDETRRRKVNTEKTPNEFRPTFRIILHTLICNSMAPTV